MVKPTFIQLLSVVTVSLVVGTFVATYSTISNVTELENQITELKAEIVDLKEQLVKSKVIIAEQQANITEANK